jgi:hypothetical protein
MNDEKDEGVKALRRIAVAFFARHFDKFLLYTTPEEIAQMCRDAGVDEAGFVAACKELIDMAPGERTRTMLQ